MKHTRIFVKLTLLALCVCMLLGLCACGETKSSQTTVMAMDTVMTLTAYGKNREAGLNAAVGIINSMDAMLDPESPTSMVYAMNHANGENVVVSGQIAEMITDVKQVYDQSGGELDITVYPLMKLWGFIDGKYYLPQPYEIMDTLTRRCFDDLVLTSFPSSGTYAVSMPGYGEVTFAAAAKGCTADKAIEAMRNAGVESGIISLGGNVQTLGLKPDGSNWRVAIEDPNNTSSYLGVLSVGETAVVTSGSYQRYFTDVVTGGTYHHILTPSTGYPVTNNLISATVICEDGTMADCLSTALFVLGEIQSEAYWRQYGKTDGGGFEIILVTKDNRIICSSGLIEEFTLNNENYSLTFIE